MSGHHPAALLPDPLRRRNVVLVLSATAVSTLGSGMVPVALSFALLERGAGAGRLGLVLAAQTLPMVTLLLLGGVLADRFAPRRVMVAADLLRAAAQAALAALLLSGPRPVALTVALVALVGIGTALEAPGRNRLLTQLVPPDRLAATNGLLATVASGGGLLGPAVGGLLVAAAGAGWAIALDAGSYALSAALLGGLRIAAPASASGPAADPGLLRALRDGWTEFTARRWVWLTVCFFAVLLMLSWAPTEVLAALDFSRQPHGSARWGLLLTLMGAGATAGGLLAARLRPRRPIRAVLLWMLSYPLLPASLATPFPFPLQAICFGLAGLVIANVNVLWETTLQRAIPADRLSRVSAYDAFGSLCLLPLGYALAAPMAILLGASGALWAGAALVLVAAALLLLDPAIRDAGA